MGCFDVETKREFDRATALAQLLVTSKLEQRSSSKQRRVNDQAKMIFVAAGVVGSCVNITYMHISKSPNKMQMYELLYTIGWLGLREKVFTKAIIV